MIFTQPLLFKVLAVRGILIKGDSNSCNTILVAKYPSNVCPRFITKLALHLQDRKAFAKPQGSPFITSDMSDIGSDFEIIQNIPEVVGKTSQRSEQDRIWRQFDQVQAALDATNNAVEASKCDHGMVQVALLKLQSALDSLGQELPGGSSKKESFRSHRRNTSVAFEALAFE